MPTTALRQVPFQKFRTAFREQVAELADSFRRIPTDCRRRHAFLLLCQPFLPRFLAMPDAEVPARVRQFLDSWEWRLGDEPPPSERVVTPAALGLLLEDHVHPKALGAYFTRRDVTDAIAQRAIIPWLLDAVAREQPGRLQELQHLLRTDPDRYLFAELRIGVDLPLPDEIAAGQHDVARRKAWNEPTDGAFALPLETWREHMARRRQHREVADRLARELQTVDDLTPLNLDLLLLAEDWLATAPESVVASFQQAAARIRILDPTCGSGEFLLAAYDVLERLDQACRRRRLAPSNGVARRILHNLHGLDVLEEAVAICRLRLHLRAAQLCAREAATRSGARPSRSPAGRGLTTPGGSPNLRIRTADILSDSADASFDVILGNPPYVEKNRLRHDPGVAKLRTSRCGNLAAFVVERSLQLLAPDGRLGLIVPLSIATTARMQPVQELLVKSRRSFWLSFYDVYPSKLFANAKQRLCIMLASGRGQATQFFTTGYRRWKPAERPHLLQTLAYGPSFYDARCCVIPKLGDSLSGGILRKLSAHRPAAWTSPETYVSFYVHRIPYNYIKAVDFVPYFWNEVDGAKKSEDYKPYALVDRAHERPALAAYNSNLFFWWWYTLYEGYHCGQHEIQAFPLGLDALTNAHHRRLGRLATRLMRDLLRQRRRKVCRYRHTGRVEYDEFYPRRSKAIIDAIDAVLAAHYGLSAEELDYVLNYDVKYRAE